MLLKIILAVFIVYVSINITNASIGGYISPGDKKNLVSVLAQSLVPKKDDITSSYYGVKGFKLLQEPIVPILIKDNCAYLQAQYKPNSGPEISFQALTAWQSLGCFGKIHTEVTVKTLKEVLESDKSTTSDIRYALEALKVIGQSIPNPAKISQMIQVKLKEDDTLQSLGHALHAASQLGTAGNFALDRVEEVVVQADEVDGKILQWEGGLTTTSLLVTGLYRLPSAKPFTEDQAEKIGAYLLTRKTVQTPKGALALLEAASILALSNVSPISISVPVPAQVTLDKPELLVHISDILGRPLKSPPTPVVAQSATRITDDVVVLSKQPLSQGKSSVEFSLSLKLEPGQYRVALTAGKHSTLLTVRVLGPVTVDWLEIGLSDADGSSAPRLTKLKHPAKLATPLKADSSQRLSVKFALSRSPIHQAFLRLHSGAKEIIFVAELDSGKTYKVDVNLASELTRSAHFQIELILGDSVMVNPLRWSLGTIEVNLNTAEVESAKVVRGLQPEIKHLFRVAEKRPAEVVSLFFTALTAAPLLLLLVLWMKIGINFNNFTPLAIPFHVGFGGILALFTFFWLKLDMFTTCAWLIPIGGFTFLAGQKLLSHIAKQKKA